MNPSSHINGTVVDSIIDGLGTRARVFWSPYAFVAFVVFCLVQSLRPARVPAIQSITPKTLLGLGDWKARQEFMRDAAKIIRDGFSTVSRIRSILWNTRRTPFYKLTCVQVGHDKPFRVVADVGDMVILPPALANEIRNDEKLSFVEFVGQVSAGPGEQGWRPADARDSNSINLCRDSNLSRMGSRTIYSSGRCGSISRSRSVRSEWSCVCRRQQC